MTNSLTAEQQAILTLGRETSDSFIIDAKAGSGKTFMLGELLLTTLRGSTILMAFNKSIAEECKSRFLPRLDFARSLDTTICTVHSHGLSGFRAAGARPKTLSSKLNFMLKDMLELRADKDDDIWRNLGKVSRLVGMAKSSGFGLSSVHEDFPAINNVRAWHELAEHFSIDIDLVGETTIEEVIDYAQRLLTQSNARTNSIDFDDMIYLPLLLNMPLPKFDNVLIDEAQDINATRRELAFRSLKPGGRLIAVGDPNQAIYGFTGADALSLDNIGRRIGHEVKTLPLSICWRCDARIIAEAQDIVPEIKARPGADEGQVLRVPYVAPLAPPGEAIQQDFFSLAQPADAVLCRLNKPLVATCLGLLRRGKRAKIEGRDLGKRLLFHVQSSADNYAFQPLHAGLMDLDTYEQQELGIMTAKNKSESTMALFEDEVDACRLIMERCIEVKRDAGWQDFERMVDDLFGDDVSNAATITLASIHKSKGREWKRVFILGRGDYMPFHLAKQEWEVEQEYNLIYVAITRAEQTLFYVTGVQSALDKGLHREVKPQALQEAPAFLIQSASSGRVGYEQQGTAYDPDAVGHELQGRDPPPVADEQQRELSGHGHFCNECGAAKESGQCMNPACAASPQHIPPFMQQSARPVKPIQMFSAADAAAARMRGLEAKAGKLATPPLDLLALHKKPREGK